MTVAQQRVQSLERFWSCFSILTESFYSVSLECKIFEQQQKTGFPLSS